MRRQDAVSASIEHPIADRYYTDKEHWEGVLLAFVEAKLTMDNMPTVDAAPVVHGEWIGDHGEHVPFIDGSPANSCSCSICGKWLVGSDEYATFGYYCPNCGAKMDLEG